MSDGISDGYRAEEDHKTEAKAKFGHLTREELYERSKVACKKREGLRFAKKHLEEVLQEVELECDQLFTVILEMSKHR